jgi:hypothetical protein
MPAFVRSSTRAVSLALCAFIQLIGCAESSREVPAVALRTSSLGSAEDGMATAGASADTQRHAGTGEEGDPCEVDADCVEDGACYDSICWIIPTADPNPCASTADCPRGWECDVTMRCVSETITGGLGSSCGEGSHCRAGFQCVDQICLDVVGEAGEYCLSDETCAAGLLCDQNKCAEPWEGLCVSDSECRDGLVCLARRCVSRSEGQLGAPCNSHFQCAAEFLCVDHACAPESGAGQAQ